MAKELPFDEDVMTLIMGLGGPEESGQHGRTVTEMPGKNAIDIITEIRDLCEEFLNKTSKEDEGEEKKPEDKEETTDMKIDED